MISHKDTRNRPPPLTARVRTPLTSGPLRSASTAVDGSIASHRQMLVRPSLAVADRRALSARPSARDLSRGCDAWFASLWFSFECAQSGHCLPQNQSVNVVGALVGIDALEVRHVPHRCIFSTKV